MVLKKLELCGFKSFAKKTVLEFSHPISAIVGPNGSGKSNIVEALRWVVGDQTLKSLRIKKGEDLIFRGPSGNDSGQAAVTITFNPKIDAFNKEAALRDPLFQMVRDYNEIVVSRLIKRDGLNKYFINNSEVRLKDVFTILALMNVGGASRHYIVSQGATDKILHVTPPERKMIIEDALGLNIYNLKISEFEKKINQTKENILKTEVLKNEIKPHLKFLQNQVNKFSKAEALRDELKKICAIYLAKESAFLKKIKSDAALKKMEPQKLLESREKELQKIEAALKQNTTAEIPDSSVKNDLEICQKKYLDCERRLGRIEGILEMENENKKISLETKTLEEFYNDISADINKAIAKKRRGEIFAVLSEIKKRLEKFFSPLLSGVSRKNSIKDLQKDRDVLEQKIKKLKAEEQALKKIEAEEKIKIEKKNAKINNYQNRRFFLEREINNLKDVLRKIELEEIKINIKMEEFEKEKSEIFHFFNPEDLNLNFVPEVSGYDENESLKLREKLQKLRFKIEEIGEKDPEIMKEYETMKNRDEFFEKELKDLKESLSSLKMLARDLKEKIQNEFKNGLEKINKEFQKSFERIFHGGKAALKLKSLQPTNKENYINIEGSEKSEGLEIFVSLPRKRVNALEMLSGGEKSLLASALLFAVSAVNPPPFLVLDEMDSALDEANSKKYGEFLQDLSQKTQLIVVTHNRETMRRAGALYGVTLGRDGVSQLLSVRLN